MQVMAIFDLTDVRDLFLTSSILNPITGKRLQYTYSLFNAWVEAALDLCDFFKVDFYTNPVNKLQGSVNSFQGFSWLYEEMKHFYQSELQAKSREPLSVVGYIDGTLLYIDVTYREIQK